MERDLGLEIFPQLDGQVFKNLDDGGVKLRTGAPQNLRTGYIKAACPSIRTVRGDRIERVGNREYSRPENNLLAFQAARIACTVKSLLMEIGRAHV